MITEKQRESARKYEEAKDRVTVMFDKGTRNRIHALGLGCTANRFVMFATEFMLNYCERRNGGNGTV